MTGLPGFAARGVEPVAQHLTGIRYWNVEIWGARSAGPIQSAMSPPEVLGGLRSVHIHRYRWGANTNTAECVPPMPPSSAMIPGGWAERRRELRAGYHRDDPVLPVACGCGFWAYTSPQATAYQRGSGIVVGVIHAWGRIVVGRKGFRAQHARIVAAAPGPEFGSDPAARDASWLALSHAVALYPDACWLDSGAELIDAFPPTDLTPLLPEPHATWSADE